MMNKIIKYGQVKLSLLLLLQIAGTARSWAQDYSGLYYIANSNGYSATTSGNFYLYPSNNYYTNTSEHTSTTDNGQPFLTTYKANHSDNSLWRVEKQSNGYYCLIQEATGRYLTVNDALTSLGSSQAHRKRVHLETVDNPSDRNYFIIEAQGSGYNISCLDAYKSGNHKYLNPSGGNSNSLVPGSNGYSGMIGLYSGATDAGSIWYFEALIPTPVITRSSDNVVAISCTPTGPAIYYTTDGSTPDPTDAGEGKSTKQYADPFTLTDGTSAVKAVSVGSGKTTPVVTLDVPVLFGASYSYLVQSAENSYFYLLPGTTDTYGYDRLVTNSLTRPSMMWYFLNAGTVNGKQYYYIVNKESGQHLFYHTYEDSNSNTQHGYALDADADAYLDNENYLFSLEQAATGYNISPKAAPTRYLNKNGGNVQNWNVNTTTGKTATTAQWNMVRATGDKMPSLSHPVDVSSSSHSYYFNITNLTYSGYYLTPGTNVITSTDASTWYIQEAGRDDWLIYYHIVDAATGQYLYLNKTSTWSDNPLTMKVASELTSDNADRAAFVIARSFTDGQFYIVPSYFKYTVSNVYYSIFQKDDTGVLQVRSNWNLNDIKWCFTPATFQCAVPVIKIRNGQATITCSTAGAAIYYTLNQEIDATDPLGTTGLRTYTGPFAVEGTPVVRAFAIMGSNIASMSTVAAYSNALTTIARASEITSMSGNYYLAEGFVDDLSEAIGSASSPFTGQIDGGYHSFSLSHPLFACVQDATIKNVVVSSATISGGVNTGALCNVADGTSRIYNCGILGGSISGSGAVGGLVGKIQSGSDSRVVNCYNYAAVSGGSHAAGIVGRNDGANARIALCMMYGDVTDATVISPVYSGTHTGNVSNFSEYNYYRSKANVPYTLYNDQSAIDKDEYLTRFPFYRHILNTHRHQAAYFLFGDYDTGNVDEIGHWVLSMQTAAYPIVEDWQTGTKRTTVDINDNLPTTTADYAGRLLTDMGTEGYLTVNVSINGSRYSSQLPITDMDTLRYDYTWGKVVLPFANEYSGWTRNYSTVCTGWKITSVTGGTEGTYQHYNMTDRDCTAKDLYANSGYIFAQGGYYVVPYGVTAISIEAHFANAFYLSDPTYETGFTANYATTNQLGSSVPESYHGQTVYTSLETLVADLAETNNPHDQAIVLVGNYHFNVTGSTNGFNVRKAVTIMSADEDSNQEPDYGWYTSNAYGRLEVPALRFDFVPNIEMGMAARVTGTNRYPGIGIWHARGWFELTETCVSIMSQCEINSSDFLSTDNGRGNNRWIANSGCFVQIVRARDNNCTKLSYIQIGGNAYVEEFYPGSHTDTARENVIVPIVVTGGEVKECFMSGYAAGGTLTGDTIRFWCTGGKIHKYLGCYMEEPVEAGLKAKIDHALIGRFFGGGTSSSARIKGDIDVTLNNSKVDFYCGGPEFGDMYSGKTVTTRATNTTFGNYYGAGFGGTALTYVRHEQMINAIAAATMTYPIPFTEYTDRRLGARNDNSFATCYKFEYIYHSNGYQTVARYYTGYALFSLATTGSITNHLTDCHILGDFYGAGCQGKVSGTVTSTLTDCTIDGDAYGGGFKAESNEVSVYPETQPTYSVYTRETGIFSGFGTVAPETYTWKQGTAGTSSEAAKELYTNVTLTDLGNVTGDISILIDGGNVGNVFGGGNESRSLSNTSVDIRNKAVVNGNVYGGGNRAEVEGKTHVQIGKKL